MTQTTVFLDLSRARSIRPKRGFDAFGLFSGRGMSRRRRLAAAAPLLVALIATFAIPTYASGDTFKSDNLPNHRSACVAASGGVYNHYGYPVNGVGSDSMGMPCNLFFKQLGGNPSQCLPGCEFVGDYQLTDNQTGAKIYAYCTALSVYRNLNAIYGGGPAPDLHISYILTHYYPFAPARWGVNDEATAVQLGIWYFSDNNTFGPDTMDPWNAKDIPFEEPTPDTHIPAAWVDRWKAVITDANANAQTWANSLPSANWSLSLASSSSSVNVGGSATITATLTGVPVDQTITFKSSSGLLNGGATPVSVVTSGGKASVTLSGVGANQSASVSATATVASEGATTLVQVEGTSQKLVYAVPSSSIQSQAIAVPFVGTPAITAKKTVDGVTNYSIQNVGETLHFSITVSNSGNVALPSFAVSDVLKGSNLDMLQNIHPTSGGSFDASTRNLTFTGGALAIGQSAAFTFDADVPTNLPRATETCFVNVATATAPGTPGATSNQATACITPGVCATVSPTVAITGPSQAHLAPGQSATYSVAAGNNGANTFAGTLTVQLPSGFSIASATPGGSINGTTATFTIPSLGPAQTESFAVTGIVPATQAAGTVTANATLAGDINSPAAGCPPASATVNSSTNVAVLVAAVQGVSTSTPVPFTGAKQGFLRTTIVGICLLISGLIILSTSRRNSTDWERQFRRCLGHRHHAPGHR